MPAASFLLAVCLLGSLASAALADSNPIHHGYGPETVQQYSGYIDVNMNNGKGAHIFYWAFESRGNPSTDPLVLWMTGGPGCSSELAVFYEQGPYRISEDNRVVLNEHSWINEANVIFVDQPVGTGFSYADEEADYVVSEEQVAEDMYEFMQAFYEKFPSFLNNELYVTGESYAGHYVPAVSHRILVGNQAGQGLRIPLAGLAIGNGMVQAAEQYPSYLSFAKEEHLVPNKFVEELVQGEEELCQKMIEHKSVAAMPVCNSIIMTLETAGGGFNVYDVRKKCEHPPLCYDFSQLDALMSSRSVQQSLGVNTEKASWTECNMKVHAYLMKDWFTDCSSYLPPLLHAGVKVLVYHGTKDFICNYKGGLEWVHKMQWRQQGEFAQAHFQDWSSSAADPRAGQYKSAGPLTFLEVFDAGHMVPMDQPSRAQVMLRHFFEGGFDADDSGDAKVLLKRW